LAKEELVNMGWRGFKQQIEIHGGEFVKNQAKDAVRKYLLPIRTNCTEGSIFWNEYKSGG
jgi:hypothetical protein